MGEFSRVARRTVGLDLGDRFSQLAVLDAEGQLIEEGRVATREDALRQRFRGGEPMRIALETGTHSPWVYRVLRGCGHEVLVANSRKLRLIYQNRRKNDRVDALYLARLARLDPKLLWPVEHRGAPRARLLANRSDLRRYGLRIAAPGARRRRCLGASGRSGDAADDPARLSAAAVARRPAAESL